MEFEVVQGNYWLGPMLDDVDLPCFHLLPPYQVRQEQFLNFL